MKKTIKFTPAKLASLKHPISKHPDKLYDSGCTGLAVFVMPQPSLPIAPAPRKKEYHYYSSNPAPKPEPVNYFIPYEPKSR